MIELGSPLHLLDMGLRKAAGATAAFQRCMATGDAEFAPYAGCQLGAILTAEGDFANAKAPLWFAVRSEHAVYAPLAAYPLAETLLEEGDRAGAREFAAAGRRPAPGSGHRPPRDRGAGRSVGRERRQPAAGPATPR